MGQNSPYLSLSEAGKLSGYTAEYLRQLCVKGKLVGTKIGKSWVVSEEELNKFLGISSAEPPTFEEIKSADFFTPPQAAYPGVLSHPREGGDLGPDPASSAGWLILKQKASTIALGLIVVFAATASAFALPDAIRGLKTGFDEINAGTQAAIFQTLSEYVGSIKNKELSIRDEESGTILGEQNESSVPSRATPDSDPESRNKLNTGFPLSRE